jgi:AcrR family transcriptional regulator
MNDETLTAERILEVAEDVLRKYGPAKATVVDVARALGVSHGSVYRHFPSKAALRDVVAKRWLARSAEPLRRIVGEKGKASKRLRRWFEQLIASKRERALGDPELFATYLALAGEAREVVKAHVDEMLGQVESIIASGVADGEFRRGNAAASARALFTATTRFHNPMHAGDWGDPAVDRAFDELWILLIQGLAAR